MDDQFDPSQHTHLGAAASRRLSTPGLATVFLLLILVGLASSSVAGDWEFGSWPRWDFGGDVMLVSYPPIVQLAEPTTLVRGPIIREGEPMDLAHEPMWPIATAREPAIFRADQRPISSVSPGEAELSPLATSDSSPAISTPSVTNEMADFRFAHLAQDSPPVAPEEPIAESPSDALVEPVEPPTGTMSGGIGEAETLGDEPADYSLQFLRQQTVLLAPGEFQFDVGLTYSLAEDEFPLLAVTGDPAAREVSVVRTRLRQRLLRVPLEVRYGLTNRIQVFANVPFGWSNTELTFPGQDEFSNAGGIGDVSSGMTMLLRHGCDYCPAIVGTLGFIAPTGKSSLALALTTPESQLGEGYWSALANLLFIHTYDPVVLFYGFGARYRFENTFEQNINVEPGTQFSYQLGVGFAVNERITLSTAVLGSYYTEDYVNGQRVEGSIRELMSLRVSATVRCGRKIVEPFAHIGFTDDSPSGILGVVWTY